MSFSHSLDAMEMISKADWSNSYLSVCVFVRVCVRKHERTLTLTHTHTHTHLQISELERAAAQHAQEMSEREAQHQQDVKVLHKKIADLKRTLSKQLVCVRVCVRASVCVRVCACVRAFLSPPLCVCACARSVGKCVCWFVGWVVG